MVDLLPIDIVIARDEIDIAQPEFRLECATDLGQELVGNHKLILDPLPAFVADLAESCVSSKENEVWTEPLFSSEPYKVFAQCRRDLLGIPS